MGNPAGEREGFIGLAPFRSIFDPIAAGTETA